MLDMLGDLEIQRLLVEGGPKTINHFLEEDFVNEFILVKSEIEHSKPIIADFDLTQFSQSKETSWGNEKVIIHSQ